MWSNMPSFPYKSMDASRCIKPLVIYLKNMFEQEGSNYEKQYFLINNQYT